jgi:hypothetical protein
MDYPINHLIQAALAASNMTAADLAQLETRLAEEAQDAYYSSPEYQAMVEAMQEEEARSYNFIPFSAEDLMNPERLNDRF